jgi:phospholipase/lecithinase/hemolysin
MEERTMKSTSIKKWTLVGLLTLVLVLPGLAAAQGAVGRIVVFGTSLSDPGNDFALRGIENVPPYDTLDPFLVPDAPYAKGGHHVSNGATWIEQFARPQGLAGNTRPAYQGPGTEASNYAVKGARAYDDGININLPVQVDKFLSDFNGSVPSDALYVLEFGGNDIRDALIAFASGNDGGPIIADALTAIGQNIGALYGAGARKFLVWKAPNPGLTPAIRILDSFNPGAAQLAGFLTQVFNTNLDAVMASLSGLPGIEIRRLDVFTKLNDLVSNPGAYGLIVVDTACVTPNSPPFECSNPDEYLFWDGIHPTKAVHGIIAQEAAFVLAH